MSDFKEGGVPTPDYDTEDINYISQKTEFTEDVFVYGKLYADLGGDLHTFTGNVDIDGHTNLDNVSIAGVATVTNIQIDNSSGSGISFLNDESKIQTGSSAHMLGIQGGATHMGGRIELRGGNDTGDIRMFAQGATSTQVERLRIENAGNVNITQNVKVAGVVTATSFSGSGADLTGLQAGKFVTDGVGITTTTPVGIETTSLARKDLTGPAGNTATGAGSSFHGAYMGDGFLSFNTEFSNPTGYYISTFTNALVAGPMQLGPTLSIDGTFTIV